MDTNSNARNGLPVWTYNSDELLELEKELVFRRQWLLVGHVSQIPNPGDYMCLDEVDERAIVVRGQDDVIRGFHNLCRHRGSRIVDQDTGHAGRAITCPFHGWCYNLDGTLRGVPQPDTFPGLNKAESGLKALDLEVWHGLVFVRFKGEGPSVAESLAGLDKVLAPFGINELQMLDWNWQEDYDVNWKSVMDVDNEGYHVPIAHPGLHALFETYVDDEISGGIGRSTGKLREDAAGTWSVRHYLKMLPEAANDDLPESKQKSWTYYGVFPNLVITVYPDACVDVYQTFPRGTHAAVMRGFGLGPSKLSRENRLLRYLKDRIDRETVVEDAMLIRWSNEAMRSSAFDGVVLSDAESGVMSYHETLREMMPVIRMEDEPESGTIFERNAELGGGAI